MSQHCNKEGFVWSDAQADTAPQVKHLGSEKLKLIMSPCDATGDVKEFGFREITNEKKVPEAEEPPLQPVPVPPPERMADPSIAVTVCVSGMVSSAEVPSCHTLVTTLHLQQAQKAVW